MAAIVANSAVAALCDHAAMMIAAPCVVSLSWTLSDAQGHEIDRLAEAVEFFYGGSDLLPKVEEALSGHEAGYEAHLHLEPEHAFGDYRSELVCFEARTLFPEQLEVGMHFEGLPEGSVTPGMPADVLYAVTEIYPSHVVLDGNHPLAGIALRLHVTVREVREATEAEIEAGTLGSAGITVLNTAPPGTTAH
jgi:FKBP-type peptidyl-prolyl cis-trans isomerase SlyD